MNSKFKGQAEHFSVVQSQSVVYDTDTGNYDVSQICLLWGHVRFKAATFMYLVILSNLLLFIWCGCGCVCVNFQVLSPEQASVQFYL